MTEQKLQLKFTPELQTRVDRAETAKGVKQVDLPVLKHYKLKCIDGRHESHALRPFQTKNVAFLYSIERGALYDDCGLGKTISLAALLCLLKQRGELGRAIVLVPPAARMQIAEELRHFTNLDVALVQGPKWQRVAAYAQPWDVLVCAYSSLLRDYEYIKSISPDLVACDESHYFRNHDIKTKEYVTDLTRGVKRLIQMSATPVQNSLLDMHSQFEALHLGVFGPLPSFKMSYVREEKAKRSGRAGDGYKKSNIIGYKNMPDFKARVTPFFIRHRIQDIEDELPDVVVEDIWLDLTPRQLQRYREIRQGILRGSDGSLKTRVQANIHLLQYACDTLANFGEDDISCKLDDVVERIKGISTKVVVFCKHKDTLRALKIRLEREKIRSIILWGEESPEHRQPFVKQFWSDETIKVCMGTTALEQSINLQNSAYMICINQLYNPQRVVQLVGRIRRIGSKHSKVILLNYITKGTFEDRLQNVLRKRAALHDYLFDEKSDIFEQLSEAEIYDLLGDIDEE